MIKQSSFWEQVALVITHGARAEWADKERIISPILFAMTVILLFNFSLGDTDPRLRHQLFTAEAFMTGFLALQICYVRVFEPDQEDKIFELLRSYPLNPTAWYIGKYILVLILSSLILFPTVLIAAFIMYDPNGPLISWFFTLILWLSIMGLSAIGVLLSAITLKARARQILFPLLYFPLTTPVLLAGVSATLTYLDHQELNEAVQGWTGLLCLFNVIYLTLGILLFAEIVDDSQ
jgi:heme exporter protein B